MRLNQNKSRKKSIKKMKKPHKAIDIYTSGVIIKIKFKIQNIGSIIEPQRADKIEF
jgi:hypothetical protein